MATEVEVFIGVTVKNEDGSEDRYSETGVLSDGLEPPKLVAVAGMKTLKKVLSQVKEKT